MSDKVKEIVLKSVLVVASFCLIMMPISTVLAIWIEDYTDYFALAFFVVGGIFILLLFILDYKIKPVPAEKFSLNFKSYNAFMDFMEKKLENQGYKKIIRILLRKILLYLCILDILFIEKQIVLSLLKLLN